MSFAESVISVGFIQKTVKVDLDVRINRAYTQRNRHQKVLEDIALRQRQRLPGGIGQPLRPTVSLHVVMSVLHRLLGCMYTVL